MLIHHFHPDTGVHLGTTEARPDPGELLLAQEAAAAQVVAAGGTEADALAAAEAVRPTVFMLPLNATFLKPPRVRKGREAVWMDGRWTSRPIAGPPADEETPAAEDPAFEVRRRRDRRIRRLRWMVDRHRDQLELGMETSLSPARYLLLLQHIQALRDLPLQAGFPHDVQWPELAWA